MVMANPNPVVDCTTDAKTVTIKIGISSIKFIWVILSIGLYNSMAAPETAIKP